MAHLLFFQKVWVWSPTFIEQLSTIYNSSSWVSEVGTTHTWCTDVQVAKRSDTEIEIILKQKTNSLLNVESRVAVPNLPSAFNTVPHDVLTLYHKIIFLQHHDCSFAAVMNQNLNMYFPVVLGNLDERTVWPPPKGVETHRLRTNSLKCIRRLTFRLKWPNLKYKRIILLKTTHSFNRDSFFLSLSALRQMCPAWNTRSIGTGPTNRLILLPWDWQCSKALFPDGSWNKIGSGLLGGWHYQLVSNIEKMRILGSFISQKFFEGIRLNRWPKVTCDIF